MSEPHCSECGQKLSPGSAETECLACLLGAGLSDEDAVPDIGLLDENAMGSEAPGQWIGRYRLLEPIGEGGYGTVWMAEQSEPVRRRVALKLIKLGMDTKQVVARFEAERQALALMDHQNIARVFDGGATENGRPYFVMELVRGIPLTTYCDTARLNLRERMDLFIQVCQAVQHAHQKGIIHRDLKPSNVLVTEQDGKPLPKVIDFGIAKATEAQLTEKTLFTRFNQLIGTPAYMSPEQAGLGSLDIDTRSDIYSLGVLLYELLTGRTPLDAQKLRNARHEAILQTIREVEPIKPSTRLSTLTLHDLTTIAGHRHEEPERLRRLVHGDLDWIALKALEKDRTRRYASANDLAADLQRFLKSEPILARPPSNLYRLQKLARRNKVLFGAAAAVLFALVAGLMATSWQWVQASRNFRQSRLNAYASEVSLAQQALTVNNRIRALELLDRQKPKPGEKEDLRGFEWRYLWQLARPQEVATVSGNRNAVAFSPDGSLLAICENQGFVIRTAASRQVVTNLPGQPLTFSFSVQDKLLAVGEREQVRIWNTETWSPAVPPLPGATFPARFSPDGQWLITGARPTPGEEPQHLLWRTDTWEPVASCQATPELSWQLRNALAFSPDGSVLVTPWLKTTQGVCGLRFWKVPSLEPSGTLLSDDIEAWSTAFMPDGRHLVIGTFFGELVVWDLQEQKVTQRIKAGGCSITTISMATQANVFATTSDDQSVTLWDSQSLKILNRFLGHTGPIWASSFTPDGRLLATVSYDGTAKFWDTTARESAKILRHGSLIAGFSRDSKTLVLAPSEVDYHWHLLGSETLTVAVPSTPPLRLNYLERTYDINGDGTLGVLGRTDGTIELWDLRAGRLTRSWRAHTNEIKAAVFSPTADRLATGDAKGLVNLWDTRSQDKLDSFQLFKTTDGAGSISRLEFSPNGETLAAGSWPPSGHGDVVLWDLVARKRKMSLPGPDQDISAIAFSPDGRLLAASSMATGGINIWDLPSGRIRSRLKSHLTGVVDLDFSPDGRTLATGSYEAVKLWNVAAEQEVASLPPDNGVLRSLCFSPDGRTLALAYFGFPGHFVRLYHAPSLDEISAREEADQTNP